MAALTGNVEAAKIMVQKRPDLLYLRDDKGYFPVVKAAMSVHRPTVDFFIAETKDDGATNPYASDDGVLLLIYLIDSEFLG